MINVSVMIGNLVKDPEKVGSNEKTTVCKFPIAVDGIKEDDVSYFPCVAFGKAADNILKYCKKGNKVCIEATPHSRTYTDKDGNKQFVIEFLVSTCEFLTPKEKTKEKTKEEKEDSPMPW